MPTFECPPLLFIDDQESSNPNCFMERGNARKCSLDHLIVSSSPSLVQELYQDDEILLLTPQQLLDNACQDQENYDGRESTRTPSGLLPRNSGLYQSRKVNLGGNSFPYNDEIFRYSEINQSTFNDSYIYNTPKNNYNRVPSPPPIARCDDENFGLGNYGNTKLLIPMLD